MKIMGLLLVLALALTTLPSATAQPICQSATTPVVDDDVTPPSTVTVCADPEEGTVSYGNDEVIVDPIVFAPIGVVPDLSVQVEADATPSYEAAIYFFGNDSPTLYAKDAYARHCGTWLGAPRCTSTTDDPVQTALWFADVGRAWALVVLGDVLESFPCEVQLSPPGLKCI